MLIRIIYSFIIVWCVPSFFKFGDDINYTNSVLPILLFLAIVISLGKIRGSLEKLKISEKLCYCIFAFIFLACMSIGKMVDTKGYIDVGDIKGIIAPFLVTPYIAGLITKLYDCVDGLELKINNTQIAKKEYLLYFVFMAVCWLIVLLGVYPGFFVYDATDELLEVVTRNFTTHHPIMHVLYLGGIVQAGYKMFGSYNAGIFVFSLIQMLIFDVGIVYVISKMSEFGFAKIICRITVVFMGLFPIIPMIVLCSCKDSIFALVMLIWIVKTYEFIRYDTRKNVVIWIVLSCLMCLLRNNAVYALIVSGVIIALVMKRKRHFLMMAVSIVAYVAVSFMLVSIFDASSSEYQEMLTVPIQQIARTYNLEPDIYSTEEIELLYEYIPSEYLRKYRPKLADTVKVGFVNEKYAQDKSGFWKIWILGLKKSPVAYLNAWLMTSYGYWYPDTVVDVYSGNQVYTFTYDESSYFGYETEEPGLRKSLIPIIDEFYKNLSLNIFKEKMPIVSMFFSMGFIFWMFVFGIGYIARKGGFMAVLPYTMPIMTMATLLLGPTYLPRYVFFIWLCLPFVFGNVIKKALLN